MTRCCWAGKGFFWNANGSHHRRGAVRPCGRACPVRAAHLLVSPRKALTAGQVSALLHYDLVGAGPHIERLRLDSITTLIALGYLKQHRETREYCITPAGRAAAESIRKESA